MEVFSRAGRYDGKADMFSVVILICEFITTYMVPSPHHYPASDVRLMVDAAVEFLQPRCPEMAQLIRDGFTDTAAARPSAKAMLGVLESAPVIAACAAEAAAPVRRGLLVHLTCVALLIHCSMTLSPCLPPCE